MSDLIKRSDAIKAIEELPNAYNGWSDTYDKAYIIGTLEEVPSADRPSGEWVFGYDDETKEKDLYAWTCSLCGEKYPWQPNYCPNCGARMKGADDE